MKVALLGDIAFLGAYSIKRNPHLLQNLEPIVQYLKRFDLVVGNLETPFSIKKKPWGAKSSYICADIENIEILKALGVSAVSIANNHMFDFGEEGFNTTINILTKAGIEWFGANGKDYKVNFGNNNLSLEGFCCYSTNPQKISKEEGKLGINRFNVQEIQEILKKNQREGRLSILSIHSGIEHVNRPSLDQIHVSRLFGEITPYVWYGHHPHVVQGVDVYKNSVIAHSLGNFSFAGNKDDKNRPIVELSENNRKGMILELEIDNNKVVEFKTTPIYIGNDGIIRIDINDNSVNTYSSYINQAILSPKEYSEERLNQRKKYLSGRKEMRNISWFLKRLRPRYFKLYFDNKKNIKAYKKNVKDLLKT